MKNEKGIKKATASEIFRYSIGSVGSNITFALITSYLMYFYTDIFGISALSVGSLFLFSRLIDAVTDPIMGMVSDRTKTKLGRYRPWIVFGVPFLALNIILLFTTFDLTPGQKVIYAYVTYITYSLLSTAVNIPYHSLTAIMSDDSNQRTDIASAKQIMSIPANLFIAVATLPLVNLFGGGQTGWQRFGILVAFLTAIAFYICAWGAKKHDVIEVNNKRDKISIKSQLNAILKNKPLLLLMFAFCIQLTASAISASVHMYYMTYNLNRVDLVPLIGLLGTVVAIPIAILIPIVSRKVDKKIIFIFGSLLSASASTLLYFTPWTNISMIVIASILEIAFGQIPIIIGWSMLPDCVDYAKLKTGINAAGTVSSSLTFANKFGGALGGLIVGGILSSVGYMAGSQQTMEVLDTIVLLKCMAPALACIISSLIIVFYPITNVKHGEIINGIEENECLV